MNSNLLIGNTLKSKRQQANDAVRALRSARVNLEQSIRFGMRSDTIARSEQAVSDQEQAVAFWTTMGVLA